MALTEIARSNNYLVVCGDTRNVGDNLLKKWDPDIIVADPPFNAPELYNVIPCYEPGKHLLLSWGHRSFADACGAASQKGWPAMFEFVWDCVQSWYTPGCPLARHKSIGLYGDARTYNYEMALIKTVDQPAGQINMFGGVDNPLARTVKNTRSTYVYTPTGCHLSTVYQHANTALKRTGYPHQKPLPWIRAILMGIRGGAGNKLVLDMFAGGGSFSRAALSVGMRVVAIEIDADKCVALAESLADNAAINEGNDE